MKQLVITITVDAVDDFSRSLKGLGTENPVNLRTDLGVGVKKMGPSVRELLSAAQLGSIARGRPRGRPRVGGSSTSACHHDDCRHWFPHGLVPVVSACVNSVKCQ